MAKYLHIHVYNPCSEEWDAMNEQGHGRFCNTCSKTVVDFSEMSDEQLLLFFKNYTKPVCGRFHTDQVERNIPIPHPRKQWFKYFLQVSIPALLLSLKAGAQDLLNTKPTIHFTGKKSPAVSLPVKLVVDGIVRNVDGNPIPSASVVVAGTSKGVAADSNGVFRIELEANERTLEISSVGYEKKSIAVNDPGLEVQLNIATAENITVVSGFTTCRSSVRLGGAIGYKVIDDRFNIFKKPDSSNFIYEKSAINVFPNPAKRQGSISIRWNIPVNHDQQVRIYNAAGIQMLNKKIVVKQELVQEQLLLDLPTAGLYFLQAIDLKTGKKELAKFVVE